MGLTCSLYLHNIFTPNKVKRSLVSESVVNLDKLKKSTDFPL